MFITKFAGAALLAIFALSSATHAQDRATAKPAIDSEEAAVAKLTKKLQTIVIPRLEFRDATVAEAVDFLRKGSANCDKAENDPAKRGVNFVLNIGATPASEARITLSLSDIPVLDALKYVTGLADLKFTIERSAVVIVPLDAKTKPASAPLVRAAPGERTIQGKVSGKLNSIIVPQLHFRDATLREAVDFLKKKTVDLDTAEPDPARRGFSVVLKLPPTTGDSGEKRITLSLKNVPLMDAFKYTAELAGCEMAIDPYALTITPMAAE